ncbi:MAG: HAMP domain-containing histidine kinase [Chloroflexi bacterium]|nr:HAMP domain-containing histidine kinase [Chloroflexota bacterium]
MISRLEESFERQRRFTADASHELRTPLTRIKVSTSEALSGEHSLDEYRAALAVADRGADVMSRLIEQLLTLARSDAGQLRLRMAPLDLGELLRSMAASVARPDGAPIRVDISEEPICVLGDEDHLRRVFLNLLENAVRHTPESGQIVMRAQADARTAVIQVIDTGEGIPAADLPHVGERFFRVDTSRSRSRGGAGLGLAICRGIAQAHGGTLSVASSPGSGTIVSVSLPAGTPESASVNRFPPQA